MNEVTPERAIEILNELYEADPQALNELCNARVSANEKLARHPTCQVGLRYDGPGYRVGILGILNAIFGASEKGNGFIAAKCETGSSEVTGFMKFKEI